MGGVPRHLSRHAAGAGSSLERAVSSAEPKALGTFPRSDRPTDTIGSASLVARGPGAMRELGEANSGKSCGPPVTAARGHVSSPLRGNEAACRPDRSALTALRFDRFAPVRSPPHHPAKGSRVARGDRGLLFRLPPGPEDAGVLRCCLLATPSGVSDTSVPSAMPTISACRRRFAIRPRRCAAIFLVAQTRRRLS